ncbi:cubilin homolog [Agrilus planipennis]|uniref:Cubilin homolog n=1 Tax=Agrilus planipennis TaxID=224129 RepID=A0A7F5R4H8_AGRPL|nr:cubilin homolog [Agrilus planipennis]
MLSAKCLTIPLLWLTTIIIVCDSNPKGADEFRIEPFYGGEFNRKELTTIFPELPQGDMGFYQPLVSSNDPCAPFVNVNHKKKEFFSPGYPDRYPNNTECVLVLEAPPGHIVKLAFRKNFSIEWSLDCKHDFLEVRDGAHGYDKLLHKPFCGSEFPSDVISTDRHLWIHFKSDDSIEGAGFKVVYDFMPRPPSLKTPEKMYCRINLTGEEGFFGSKDVPPEIREFTKENEMPIDCLWVITVKETKKVNAESGCYDDEFDCDDTTCIAEELRCNDVNNCRFMLDEEDCHGGNGEGQSDENINMSEEKMVIIMVIFCLILSGMCFAFVFNCVKKLIRDHHTIQEHIRQSREQQLNELGKQDSLDKKLSMEHRSQSTTSLDSQRFAAVNAIVPDTNCYVPGGDLLPILLRNEGSATPNGNTYNTQTVRTYDTENGSQPEMCDSACQTRESLFFPHEYSSGHSTPNHSLNSNSKPSPPAPFSTFGYKKDSKFRAEAKIEVEDNRRPYSVQTTKSAPDVIVTH